MFARHAAWSRFGLACLLAFLVLAGGGGRLKADASPCAARGTALVVEGEAHRLWTCKGGAPVRSYAVSLGVSGLGKRIEGDNRTPLGSYSLSAPRRSRQFGVFMHVGYPTASQRAQGYTGGDVGIHGPPVTLANDEAARLTYDWTAGCIALHTAALADEVAAWVRSEEPRYVYID